MKVKLCILVLLLMLAGCQRSSDKTTWRFAIEEAAGSVQDAYAQAFKQRIEARSQGQIEVKVYPYGTLGTSDQITELLHNGSLELAMASPGHLGKVIPEVQVLLLHFVLSDNEAVNREVLSSPRLLDQFNELYAEKNFHLLGMFSEGWQVWTTNKPVREPKDFAGLKFRVMTSPLLLAAYEAYGASATPLPYSDVYSALQLKMIDGQVNPVFAIEEMSFHEVTTHLTFANQAPFVASAICNRQFYQDLPPLQRQWVDETVDELESYIYEAQRRLNTERLETISRARPQMVIERLDESERDAFRKASLPVRELYLRATGDQGEKALRTLLEEVQRYEALPVLRTSHNSSCVASGPPGVGRPTLGPPQPQRAASLSRTALAFARAQVRQGSSGLVSLYAVRPAGTR